MSLETNEPDDICATVMITIQTLTNNGWVNEEEHPTKDTAFWHARAKCDANGQTYRLMSEGHDVVCLLTSRGSECWETETETAS